MKRSEVTVDGLKALGYVAKCNTINSWTWRDKETTLNARQSEELFRITVDTIRGGGHFEIRRNLRHRAVEITVRVADVDESSLRFYYYLSRPMTEEEIAAASVVDFDMQKKGA